MTTFRASLPFDLNELARLARLAALVQECQGILSASELAVREGEIGQEIQAVLNLLRFKIRVSEDSRPRPEIAELPGRLSKITGETQAEKARVLLNICRELGAVIPAQANTNKPTS